jgi:hypothetical protein
LQFIPAISLSKGITIERQKAVRNMKSKA